MIGTLWTSNYSGIIPNSFFQLFVSKQHRISIAYFHRWPISKVTGSLRKNRRIEYVNIFGKTKNTKHQKTSNINHLFVGPCWLVVITCSQVKLHGSFSRFGEGHQSILAKRLMRILRNPCRWWDDQGHQGHHDMFFWSGFIRKSPRWALDGFIMVYRWQYES